MTHVNSSVMLFVDGKALSVQNLAKKSAIAFPRSVAMGLIGGKGFVGHLGPISLFRGVRGVRAREFQSFHFFMFQSRDSNLKNITRIAHSFCEKITRKSTP